MNTKITRLFLLSALMGFSLALAAQPNGSPAIDPLRFEDAVKAFEAQDKVSPPPTGAIVLTGSSSIRRWHSSMSEDLAPLTVIPRGFGGSTMEDALYYIDRLAIADNPRAIVLYEGDNDTGRYGVPPQTIASQFKAIVAKIHGALPDTRIYVLSIKPSVSRQAYWDQAVQANRLLMTIAKETSFIHYIDVATPFLDPHGRVMTDIFIADNLHLNEKGTRIWAGTIKAALMAGEAKYE